jgi:hypothetical protein
MIMPHLTGSHWINTDKPGGRVFFVGGDTTAAKGSTGSGIAPSDANHGLNPDRAFETISQAITAATTNRGDTIVLLAGDLADISTALAMSKNDVTLTGLISQGNINSSQITGTGAIDVINVTGTHNVIENLHFAASGASITSRINAGAAGLTIRNCTFECGANDLETITVPAAGDDLLIEDCRFYVTANGPDAAIEIEASGAERVTVRNCVFLGDDDTNAWDVGGINSGVAHTACLITGNQFVYGPAIIFSAAATGTISYNSMGEGTLGSMLDPGSCMCFENYEADAINESARIFPAGIAI